MEHAQPIRTEDLLQHLSWARSLARRLVADDSTADDVVQESMAAALRTPPHADRPVRPWLARVVGNAARQRRRAEGRRAVRERGAAREEALPSAAELTGRAEAQRLLICALLELDERAREVVLLRYFQDLSSAEIARRTGEPAGTVRSRLKRALDALRERLEARFGDGEGGWRAALAPLVVPRFAVPVASAGGAAAALVAKVLLAAGVLGAIALAAVLAVGGLESLGHVPREDVAFLPQVEGAPVPEPASAVSRADAAGGRTAVTPAALAAEAAADAPPATSRATMRFVDPDGVPLAGVEVRARSRGGVSAVSGADGRATLDLRFEGPFLEGRLRVAGAGIASNVLQAPGRPGETSDLGDIVLLPGGSISGVVVDEDGQPLEDVRVWVEGRAEREPSGGGVQVYRSTGHGAVEERTDAAGRFRLDGVLAGDVRIEVATDDDLREATSGRVEVRPGRVSAGLEIVAGTVDPRRRIEGVVVDEEGEPVEHAVLRVRWKTLLMGGSTTAMTRGDGSFRALVRAGARADLEVRATDERPATARLERVRGGTHDLRIVLRAPRTVAVRALRADGSPALRATVLARTRDGERGVAAEAEGDGFRLRVPDRPFRVVVRADGHREATSERIEPGALPEVVELALRSMPVLTGRVTSGGEPLAGARVEVREVARGPVRVAGLPSLVEPHPIATATTGEDGVFEVTLRASATVVVRATAQGLAPAELGAARYDVRAGRADADLALTPGGSIEGVVQDGDGLRQVRVVLASRGDGEIRTVRTDADGAYRIDHLTPGPWMVRLTSRMMEGGGSSSSSSWGAPFRSFEPDLVVTEGRVTRHDVPTGALAPSVAIRGTVAFEGLDASRLRVRLIGYEAFGAGDVGAAPTRVAPDGTFEVRGGGPGVYALVLVDGDFDDADALRFVARLQLGAGETPFALAGSFGSIRAGDGAERAMERLLWRGPDGVAAIAPLPAEGEATRFPAGTVQRVGAEAVLLGDLDAVDVLESATLAPGGTVELAR